LKFKIEPLQQRTKLNNEHDEIGWFDLGFLHTISLFPYDTIKCIHHVGTVSGITMITCYLLVISSFDCCKTCKVKRIRRGWTAFLPTMHKSVSECIMYSNVIISVLFLKLRSRPIYRLSRKIHFFLVNKYSCFIH